MIKRFIIQHGRPSNISLDTAINFNDLQNELLIMRNTLTRKIDREKIKYFFAK